jgi:hypothetical protein
LLDPPPRRENAVAQKIAAGVLSVTMDRHCFEVDRTLHLSAEAGPKRGHRTAGHPAIRGCCLLFVGLWLWGWPLATALAARITVEADPRLGPDMVAMTNRAVEAAQAFFSREFGLTLDHDVRIVLAADKDEFIEALVHEAHNSPSFATEQAEHASGVSQNANIIEHLSRKADLGTVAFILCHEITHQFQHQTSNGRHNPVRWLSEGVADSLAARIVAGMGLGRLDDMCRQWEKIARGASDRPRLAGLHGWEDWKAARDRYGSNIVYRMGDVAVLELIDRKGLAALFDYFRLLRTLPHAQAFEKAFDLDLDNFEVQAEDRM